MEYERMREKPQGGGLSPRKLRSLLMGVEKRRTGGEDEEQMGCSSEGGCGDGEACRDVVEVETECRVSADGGSVAEIKGAESGEGNLRKKVFEDSAMVVDTGNDGTSVSTSAALFEFQKGERAAQRGGAAPFSKPAPSKWDDAQKWIASPTSNRPKVGQVQSGIGGVVRKVSNFGNVNRQLNAKVALVDADQKIVTDEEPDTKRIDSSHRNETDEQKFVNWDKHSYEATDSCSKPLQMIESGYGHSAINLSCHDSSMSIYGSTTFIPPPSTARSVSMRDMGTEMTPIASQEPSRTGTPVRSTTPTRTTSSRPSSPGRTVPTPPNVRSVEQQESTSGLSEKQLQMKTRREIMALGTQLGKTNIAAWASKAEEDNDASTSLKIKVEEKSAKSIIDARASAWEEAEKTKYIARFKRDEIRIEAWENHQKAKAEADMTKAEVEVDRIKTLAQDRLANKLAVTGLKAEEKRAAAEAKRNRQAAKTEQQAEYIRRTGRMPSSFSCYYCCS